MKAMNFFAAIAVFTAGMVAGRPVAAQTSVDTTKFEPTVYMVANAHMDTQWRWTVQQTINEFIPNTLLQNFSLMSRYPQYKFSLEGAVIYLWAKEYYPQYYQILKKYIKNGQWYPAGAAWNANDYNVPSVESNFRNILLAEDFYKKEFGVKSYEIMLPDCFGFGYTLPTVAAHCGLIGFHTQKLQWRYHPFYPDGKKYPFEFGLWEGIDGESILAAPNGSGYGWDPVTEIYDNKELLDKIKDSKVKSAFRYFGTRSSRLHGDQGGSPLPQTVAMLDQCRREKGPFKIKFAAADDMFNDFGYLKNSGFLPVFKGELLMDTHGTGGYTSNSDEKRLNRRSEQLGFAAEAGASMADWLGTVDYPEYELTEAYRRFIWHQFHDDLPGTCIVDAYTFTWNDQMLSQNQFAGIIDGSVSGVSSVMDTRTKGVPVVVFNPVTATDRDMVEVTLPLKTAKSSVRVFGPSGKEVGSQIINRNKDSVTLLFAGADPSMSMNVYDIRPSSSRKVKTDLKVSGRTIENAFYKVTLNNNGDISSIMDKRYGKEMVAAGKSIGLRVFPNNVSDDWPAWEILKKTLDKTPVPVNENVRISIEEKGPLRATLKVEKYYGDSRFVQRISLTDGAEDDRIDVKTDVDWQSMHSLLKASFPLSFNAAKANYDLGLGYVGRGSNTETAYEVPAQEWADMTADDGSYGVTVMNDCKYGWDKPDAGTLRLTLLHTPTAAKNNYVNQRTQDIGPHEFTYSIVGHKGVLDGGAATASADILNQRKAAFLTVNHSGRYGRSFSFLQTSTPEIRVKSFKKAEDGDGYIVRIYELSGRGSEGKIKFAPQILSADEDNGIEEYKAKASFSGNELNVLASGFSPKTYRVRFVSSAAASPKPEYSSVGLKYDNTAITSDAFSAFGHFDKDWHSYAAELIPDTLVHKGVPFVMGKPDVGNAVSCDGQTLQVPSGSNGVYFLVSSSEGDRTASFSCGSKTFGREIPYYSGFFGSGNWKDRYTAFLKKGDVAYVGMHRHDSRTRNEAYVQTYMYMIYVPVNEGNEIVLPKDKNIKLFAATAVKGDVDMVVPISEMVTRLKPNK
jgi:alpha-mannosidase